MTINDINSTLLAYGLSYDEFKKILESDIFRDLNEQMMKVSPRYSEIPKAIREVAIVLILAGKIDNLDGIYQSYFTRPILSINEFLTDKYLPTINKSIFPKWRENFTRDLGYNSAIYEMIFTGSIGIGKSTAAMIAQVFNLHRVMSLQNPQLAMGVAPTTKMTLLLMTILKGKAVDVLLDPIKSILLDCPLFQKLDKPKDLPEFHQATKGAITGWVDRGDMILLPNNAQIIVGSQEGHALGAGLFGASLDEAEFRKGSSSERVYKLYYQMKERVRSRFYGLRYLCLTLMSSVQSETGMIVQYAKTISKDDKNTVIYDYPIWEVRYPNAIAEDGYFYAMRGTNAHPSKILEDVEQEDYDKGEWLPPPGCKVIKVPKRYYKDFKTNIHVALMNLAGMTSSGDEKPFTDTSRIEDKKLPAQFDLVVNVEAPEEPTYDIGAVLAEGGVFRMTEYGWAPARHPDALRYCHLDLAQSGFAGLSMVHKELSNMNKVIYVVDYVIRVSTTTSISFEAIRQLMHDLKYKYNVRLHTVTCDQYQSTMMLQSMKADQIAREIHLLSVDRTAEAYYQVSNIVQSDQLKVGICPILRHEFDIIRIDRTKNKPYAEGGVRKDCSDSVVGSTFNAIMNGADQPVDSYEEIDKRVLYDKLKAELEDMEDENSGYEDAENRLEETV